MKFLSAWVCSFLSGAAVMAIRSLPVCRSEASRAGSAIGDRARRNATDNEAGTHLGRALGFALGVGCGVGVALLMAPKSGADSRSMIAAKARQGGGYLKQQVNDLSGTASDLLRRGRKEAERAEKAVVDAAHTASVA